MPEESVISLSSRRKDDVLTTITLHFGGVHYGTFPIRAPYAPGRPIFLYIVPSRESHELAGSLDCFITDDPALATERKIAR